MTARESRGGTDWNPYDLDGPLGASDPILISNSGGLSSAYLLFHLLEAHGGQLPVHCHVVFTNTGRERDETLDFLRDQEDRWRVPITWLERDFEADAGFRVVGHNSATRRGQAGPFDELIERRGYLPNQVARFCTTELKIRASAKFMQSLGYQRWASVLGYRLDEVNRLRRAEARDASGKDPWYTLAPMVDAGVTKAIVHGFWRRMPFTLRLPSVRDKTPTGNCDGCFLKSATSLLGLARDEPEHFSWWVEQEAKVLRGGRTTSAAPASFRNPSRTANHTELAEIARRQGDFFGGDEDRVVDCFCTD